MAHRHKVAERQASFRFRGLGDLSRLIHNLAWAEKYTGTPE